MARPRKSVKRDQFESLCAIQCTKAEICGVLGVTDKTLDKWIGRTYQNDDGEPMSFSEVFEVYRAAGKVSLRRAQFKLAQRDGKVAIWMGKQYLGQREPGPQQPEPEQLPDDGFLDALHGEARDIWEK